MVPLHFIKCYDFASEDDWNRFLLEPLGVVEHGSPDFSVVKDHAIYFVIGSRGLGHVPARFVEQIDRLQCKGLYHLGDEFLAGGYELYRHFDFVIRNHYAAGLQSDGIKTVPLGYPLGMAGNASEPGASGRQFAWAFLGNINAARASMIAEFSTLEPHYLHIYDIRRATGRRKNEAEYKEIIRSSVFVPCPMGNVMLETWRLYEALEAGAIPLTSRRLLMPYHDRIMPGHPIPTFATWRAARDFAERLLADTTALDALQQRIGAWWRSYKKKLQAEVCDFVAQGFAGAYRASLAEWPPRHGLGLQTWRVAELLKHHDLAAAMGRADIMLRRLAHRAGVRA